MEGSAMKARIDLEPLHSLITEIEQARLGAGVTLGDNGEFVANEPNAKELLEALRDLYWQGRKAYNELAAQIEGAKPYEASFCGCGQEIITDGSACLLGDKTTLADLPEAEREKHLKAHGERVLAERLRGNPCAAYNDEIPF